MGISHFDQITLSTGPVLPGGPVLYTGSYYFVNEASGNDGNTGAADNPFQTLGAALNAATANQNDVICFQGTLHLTSTVVWNKAQVHLIGMDAPLRRGKRARISVTGATAFAPLVNVTASGCEFRNFGTFYGFNSASNNTMPWIEAGGRNCYDNVEFLGFGDGTATTGTSNKTTSRALLVTGSTGENTFRQCTFGVDTVSRGAANYTLEIAGGSPRNYFVDCDFEMFLAAGGTGGGHLLIGAAGIDRYCLFENCRFHNSVKSSGSTLTQLANLNAAIGGAVLMNQCTGYGYTHIETTPTSQIYLDNAAPSIAADVGIATLNHSS